MRNPLVIGEIYHVFTKSIAGFKILNNDSEFLRMIETIQYYQREKRPIKFCRFNKFREGTTKYLKSDISMSESEKLVEIIAYCIMPTHIHLVLKQLKDKGVSLFMNNILNSYSRYFNIKHNRKGPLWEGRFKNVLVGREEQLLHLTRYVHLNPVTARIVNTPIDWKASSYKEYLSDAIGEDRICKYSDILNITPTAYRKFVEDRISYQRELAKIKNLLFD